MEGSYFWLTLKILYRRWVYLEPVFEAGTLKNEEALFRRIDKDFRYIMREIQADPRVISLVKINNITTLVKSLETQLSRCQNNLLSYIMVSNLGGIISKQNIMIVPLSHIYKSVAFTIFLKIFYKTVLCFKKS